MRNLDITTLRSFVAVADLGGVTRAAGFLHLTQSAVSMQLKRLEEVLGLALLDRSGRTIALTSSGEQLLTYARRMVALNDEVITRLSDQAFVGEIVLGVPHDIVYPAIPIVLKQFNAAFPRVRISMEGTNTTVLKAKLARGACDMILTTETKPDRGAETLTVRPLNWVGSPTGIAWRQRPLRLAFGRDCVFRGDATSALDRAGIDWEMAIESESDRGIEAAVAADLALHAMIEGTEPQFLEPVAHGGTLPALPAQQINLYGVDQPLDEVRQTLADLLRHAFGSDKARKIKPLSGGAKPPSALQSAGSRASH
ncbi:MAG: LysR family transcriptional regulator [Pseudomonadota bacterium]